MANQYRSRLAGGAAGTGGNALPAEVLTGKTFTNDDGAQTGTMANNGAVTQALSAGQSYTIPEGFHNGNGTVTAADISPSLTETLTGLGSAATTRDITITLDSDSNTYAYFSTGSLNREYAASGTGVTNLYSTPSGSGTGDGDGGCIFKVSGTSGSSITVTLTAVNSNSRFGGYIVKLS